MYARHWPVLALLVLAAGCATNVPVEPTPLVRQPVVTTAPGAMSDADVAREAERLRAALLLEVPQAFVGLAGDDGAWVTRAKAGVDAEALVISRAQLLVVVDRDPAVQELRIMVAMPRGPWQVIGGSKVSTGEAGRRGYFITPVGVFLHTDGILDYRALGTFNENHIRGLGLKGMRVWDFGWRPAERGWKSADDLVDIRLLMHATDPDYLEQRLGRPASQGCVRVPAAMNRFLDVHGVLDADYELAARDNVRVRSILRLEREPSPLAGNAMIVVDSSQGGRP
jgi:hypothetical protein